MRMASQHHISSRQLPDTVGITHLCVTRSSKLMQDFCLLTARNGSHDCAPKALTLKPSGCLYVSLCICSRHIERVLTREGLDLASILVAFLECDAVSWPACIPISCFHGELVSLQLQRSKFHTAPVKKLSL